MPDLALSLPEDREEVACTVPVVHGAGGTAQQVTESVDVEEHRGGIEEEEQTEGQDEGHDKWVEEPGEPLQVA